MVAYFFVKPIKINGKTEVILRSFEEDSVKHAIKKGWIPLDVYCEMTGFGQNVII